MKTLFVVWKMNDGALRSDGIHIEGKVNHLIVEKAVRDYLGYYDRYNFDRLISWQVEEEFTSEERDEFWKKYN